MQFFAKSPIILLFLAVFYKLCVSALADTNENDFKIVKRSEWGALEPRHPATKLDSLPATYVIISHTASTPCLTNMKCIYHLRNIQTLHMKQYGWDDIAYNFIVGGNGKVYEGRGWDVEGAHTKNWNKRSIGIAFVGEFGAKNPTEEQIAAAKKLLEIGIEEKNLDNNYKLIGQRQVINSKSPGSKLYDIIKTWKHWSSTP